MSKKELKSWSERVDWTTRKSRLATKICQWFLENKKVDLSFGKILEKYCTQGMSCITVAKKLRDIIGDKIIIKDSTLEEALRAERAQGRTIFSFKAKTQHNPFHGNRGIIRKYKKKPQSKKRVVEYTCRSCGHITKSKEEVSKPPHYFVGLRSHACPKCEKKGSCVALFRLNKERIHKALLDGRETFVSKKEKTIALPEKEIVAH